MHLERWKNSTMSRQPAARPDGLGRWRMQNARRLPDKSCRRAIRPRGCLTSSHAPARPIPARASPAQSQRGRHPPGRSADMGEDQTLRVKRLAPDARIEIGAAGGESARQQHLSRHSPNGPPAVGGPQRKALLHAIAASAQAGLRLVGRDESAGLLLQPQGLQSTPLQAHLFRRRPRA